MKREPLDVRFWAKVDKSGDCWEWTGYKQRQGYGSMSAAPLGLRSMLAHRIAFTLASGPIPEGVQIDHICRNRGCVNLSHLRMVTGKQNMENQDGHRNSKSGVRGVSWREDNKRWQAKVRHMKRDYHVGYFKDLSEAEAAVTAKRLELFTHNEIDRAA